MKTKQLVVMLAFFAGCTSNTTWQEKRQDGTTVTRTRAYGFAAGKSAMRDVKLSNSPKAQSVGVGSLDSESDATPLAQVIGAVIMKGLEDYFSGGATVLRAPPRGYKLVPVDDPSHPQPEIP